MEEKTRALNVRPLLVALAVMAAAASIWAATALAGGGSSTSSEPAANSYPTTVYVQTEDDGRRPCQGRLPGGRRRFRRRGRLGRVELERLLAGVLGPGRRRSLRGPGPVFLSLS